MGETTKISWTDATWNPWRGCSKVSPGCANCYMFKGQKRWGRDPSVVVRASDAIWNQPYVWNDEARAEGNRRLVFTCSWSDFFHQDADEWRDDAWRVIRDTPWLTYQILTKRPYQIRGRLPEDWCVAGGEDEREFYPNVWLGVSAENQRWADERIPVLLSVPAAVHFVSAEPLLGPLELRPYLSYEHYGASGWASRSAGLDWVIVGGESAGPQHRHMDHGWAESILAQTRNLETVAFWGKQRSGPVNELPLLFEGREVKEFPTAWKPSALAEVLTP